MIAERLESVRPGRYQPLLKWHQGCRCQGIEVLGPDGPMGDQTGTLQDTQMFADCGSADRQSSGQLADGDRAVPQLLDDSPPLRVTQCVERGLGRECVTHEQRLL